MVLFRNVCKQTFHISQVRLSQKVKSSTYFILYEDEDIGRFPDLY